MNNRWFAAALALALAVVALPEADAKRLGGGKSIGMQRDSMPQRSAPATPSPQAPAAAPNANAVPPTGAAATTAAKPAAATAAAAAPAAAAKRSWMGPLAGLAAGLGIAALASALGFGEGLAQFMTVLLLAIVGFVLVRWLLGALAARRQPALATAGVGAGSNPVAAPMQRRPFEPAPPAALPQHAGGTAASGAALRPITIGEALAVRPSATGSLRDQLPAGFDLPGFERLAKMVFIRMQAAHDTADLDDLRQFTTPEMFAAVRLDLQERGGVATQTDVEFIEAELVDFSADASRQIASVRFRGSVREDTQAPAEAVDELWHLVRPLDDSRPWAIAGIQQVT